MTAFLPIVLVVLKFISLRMDDLSPPHFVLHNGASADAVLFNKLRTSYEEVAEKKLQGLKQDC